MKEKKRWQVMLGNNKKSVYRENKDLINKRNYVTVKALYMAMLFTFAFLTVFTYYYRLDFTLTKLYGISFAITSVIGMLYFLFLKERTLATHILYYILTITVYINALLIGTVFNPDQLAAFFFVTIIVLPVLYIEPPIFSLIQITTASIIFGITTCFFKADYPMMVRYDMINGIVCFMVSTIFTTYIRSVHIENMQMIRKYEQQAKLDVLTGTYNKEWTEILARNYIEENSGKENISIMLVDMDNFKEICNNLGYFQADQVLKSVGEVLQRLIPKENIIGRMDRDIFCVLLKNTDAQEAVLKKAEQISQRISTLFSELTTEKFSCCIGIYTIENDKKVSYEAAMLQAEQVLIGAKKRGHNEILCYDDMYETESEAPIALVIDSIGIRRAMLCQSLKQNYMVICADSQEMALKNLKKYKNKIDACILYYDDDTAASQELINTIRQKEYANEMVMFIITMANLNEYQLALMGIDGKIEMPFDGEKIHKRMKEAEKFRKKL